MKKKCRLLKYQKNFVFHRVQLETRITESEGASEVISMHSTPMTYVWEESKMVDAEWLLKSHRELLGVEKALQRRIKQLKMDDNENDVIESMELGTTQEAGMPRAQSRFGSKTERAASDFREKAAEERDQAQEQTQILKEKLRKVQENLKLYDVVFESMDSEEQWLIEEYYGRGKSIDTLLEMQREKGQFVSKSTMRRRKLRVVEKARKVIFMVTSLDRGCLES